MALLVSLAFVAISCGGSSSETPPESPPPPPAATSVSESTPRVVSDADAAATSSARFREVRESAEYKAAVATAESCLADAGYQRQTDGGVMLKDGTIFKPGPGGQAVRGAYLQYRLDLERCSEDSGLYDVAARAGYQMRPQIRPSDLTSMNTQTISVVQCMKGQGWNVPEPRTLHGLLVLEIPELSAEEEAAWLEDQLACYGSAR
ncbi:MAG: hypothetical protein WD557_16615 [Dehalococcoidia bacterium]